MEIRAANRQQRNVMQSLYASCALLLQRYRPVLYQQEDAGISSGLNAMPQSIIRYRAGTGLYTKRPFA